MTQHQELLVSFHTATDADMYDVMDIRNSAREFMTHYTGIITPEEQYDWWMRKDDNAYKIWLVTVQDSDPGDCDQIIAGFCMIRAMPEGYYYGTLALLPDYRGRGIGTAIYNFMKQWVDELWLDIRVDNHASIGAARNAGFRIVYTGTTEAGLDIVTMVHRKEYR